MMLRTPDSAAPSEEYFYHATDMSTEQVSGEWEGRGGTGERLLLRGDGISHITY